MTRQARTRGVPDASVRRLPTYLRALSSLLGGSTTWVSSETLAELTGVRSAQLRKDLSHLGSYGVRGVGYDVEQLAAQISNELGLSRTWPVLIVGLGNLGRALTGYRGFSHQGFEVVALADTDPRVIGQLIEGVRVRSLAELAHQRPEIMVAVITTPDEAAQQVAEQVVAMGVRSVLNFTATTLVLDPAVTVRTVDLTTELQILAFHQQRAGVAGAAVKEVSG